MDSLSCVRILLEWLLARLCVALSRSDGVRACLSVCLVERLEANEYRNGSVRLGEFVVDWGWRCRLVTAAEAVSHYDDVSPFVGAEAQSSEAAVGAIQYTFFHWGVSAWTAYVVVALPIAYCAYRYDAPMRISTVLAPWVGIDNLETPIAKAVDILAVFATIGGVATTLGLVGSQFLVGLEWTMGVSVGDLGTILIITGMTVAFTASVALGVQKGIRRGRP